MLTLSHLCAPVHPHFPTDTAHSAGWQVLNEGRTGVTGKVGREERKSGSHSPICVCPHHSDLLLLFLQGHRLTDGQMDKWTDGFPCLNLAAQWSVEGDGAFPGGQPRPSRGSSRGWAQAPVSLSRSDRLAWGACTSSCVTLSSGPDTQKQTGKEDCLIQGCFHIQSMSQRRRNEGSYISLPKFRFLLIITQGKDRQLTRSTSLSPVLRCIFPSEPVLAAPGPKASIPGTDTCMCSRHCGGRGGQGRGSEFTGTPCFHTQQVFLKRAL